ncbi:BREX-1 system adenine-specific DNA-methyltransferase PglX [Psychrobacillus sp. FSL K6-1267]|uniref:BREX-1 system adenine-specific DNA-methyltransferase PglX n=1 Tax=Psychrobacillus sp. FSL K6-1267 TaxID=2921543 RepID=UPI0030F8C9BC
MNKAVLKKFASEARRELLEKVELQARKIGITAESVQEANVESSDAIFIDGKQLSDLERRQRSKLISRINEISFQRVMEETAYTWFNRFIALRYMEVNDYLPTKVRVLSSNSGSAEPDMMKDALSLDLDLDKVKVYDMKINNETDELFKYLIKMHCNDLNRYMPFMFETIEDYSEILFPEGLLGTDSFVRQMTDIEFIPESNWEKVEIIGWLYQYYIAEEKDEVFANLKKNIKITKDTLPAATQLFTPNWIVRYMVENSLGRIWLESYPESSLQNEWKYYLDEAEQEEEVIKQLEEIRYKNVNPEDITFLDPCCGSGHILVYAFDVFYDMYLEKGYMENEIPQLILENNLYGLDVDDRAVQLASFAVMMKARAKSRRVFRKTIQLKICSVQESNWLTDEMIANVAGDNEQIMEILQSIQITLKDAKEYGSLLSVEPLKYELLEQYFQEYKENQADLVEMIEKQIIEEKLPSLLLFTKIISENYDVVCTNPPYMGAKSMNDKLSKYCKKVFPNTKSDLSTVFMERSLKFTKLGGLISLINPPAWMFIITYENLRQYLVREKTFINMLHLGRGVFGPDFGTTSFVLRNVETSNYNSTYRRLFVRQGAVDTNEQKKEWFFNNLGKFIIQQKKFTWIPSTPIAYWLSDRFFEIYHNAKLLSDISELKQGIATADNDRFLRYWFEPNFQLIKLNSATMQDAKESSKKWFPYNKGGAYRKWYGNFDYVINWEDDGTELKTFKNSVVRNPQYQFKKSVTWSLTNSAYFGARLRPEGSLFDTNGMSLFISDSKENYILSFLCSKISTELMKVSNPTLASQVGDVGRMPIIYSKEYEPIINKLVEENIEISKRDWDCSEISWDFKVHPFLIKGETKISDSFQYWERETGIHINQIKKNEEDLNRNFIEIYNLEDELTPEVDEADITIRKVDLEHDTKRFISYAIGCSFGRYSLDEEGLIFAGGDFDASRYKTFPADEDNILPILPGAYFEDDIVTRFVDFVRMTFSEETLEENLDFVSDAIGRKKNETAKEVLRRYFMNDFYKDHVQVYKKRPIYWMFTSGKEKAFNCLIYMHRYDKTTLSRIRTDYLHEVQIRMDAEKKDLLDVTEGDSTTKEISDAKKELKSLDKKIDELKAYDELLHHMADMQIEINLDDGVQVNYEKFKGLLAKI